MPLDIFQDTPDDDRLATLAISGGAVGTELGAHHASKSLVAPMSSASSTSSNQDLVWSRFKELGRHLAGAGIGAAQLIGPLHGWIVKVDRS